MIKLKIVGHSNDLQHKGFLRFCKSMDHFGYDYVALNEPDYNWGATFNIYLREAMRLKEQGYTHILTVDTWDTIAFAPPSEIIEKYVNQNKGLFSTELACFPNGDLAKQYPESPFKWKYINNGGTLFPIDLFIEVFSQYDMKLNIQEWSSLFFVNHYAEKGAESDLMLDIRCNIFQTVGHCSPDDFLFENGRLINKQTLTTPILIHGNGRVNMDYVYDYWDKTFA